MTKLPYSSLMDNVPRELKAPDFVYKGLFSSDGVVENGVKILPKINNLSANATNLFKRSLFAIETQQQCDINTKLIEIKGKRESLEEKYRTIVQEAGGEEHGNQPLIIKMREDM